MTNTRETGGRLAGKVAIVTGGAGNIGRVIVRRHLEEAATVVITGRSEEKLQAYRQELIADGFDGERIMTRTMNGADITSVRAAVADILGQTGKIDILVNNAGSAGPRQRLAHQPLTRDDLQGNDTETLADAIGNLLATIWNPIRAIAPHMAPGSSIINVSTIFSRTNYYGRTAYVVPKAALNALSTIVARELGDRGIRVNTIYPGPIDSDRIRNVFATMDELKGLESGSTAHEFFDIMALSRPTDDGELARGFPKTTDVANAIVFLASDDSAALAGHPIEVTHGMAVPAESRSTFINRPGLRNVDGEGKTVLIAAGDQVQDALSLSMLLIGRRADVVLTFRHRDALSEAQSQLQEAQRNNPQLTMPALAYLNPLEPATVREVLTDITESSGGPHYAIIFPAYQHLANDTTYSIATASDDEADRFMYDEIGGVIALASQIQHHWEQHSENYPLGMPRVCFITNTDDGGGNRYSDMLRAATEQLIRNWRHETALDAPRYNQRAVWANQIVRYVNSEAGNLDFATAWVAKLMNSDRQIEEINLYLPSHIEATTGVRKPSFIWAENLIGLHLGKVALITGGSAGIGGEIARLLALSGAYVMISARRQDQLEQMQRVILGEMREAGYTSVERRVQYIADIDVADETALQRLVQHTADTFGRVDYLINNAGISGAEEMVIDMPLDSWRHTLQANLVSNYSLMRKIAPMMKAQGSGYILNVSSYFGGEKYVAIPYPNRSDYAVSKAGQRAIAESWARFMGPEIQINAMAPGPVDGIRLRGSNERPGLFMRRARLILENKRLNEVHRALIESQRETDRPVARLLPVVLRNDVATIGNDGTLPGALRKLATTIMEKANPEASSYTYVMNDSIAQKLIRRLEVGGYINSTNQTYTLASAPPEPFFAANEIEREARKVGDGIREMLYLNNMPTEFDVARATVYYLADRNVTGETFHPSGGLRLERTVTEGELFGKASVAAIGRLRGTTVYIIGEYLTTQITTLIETYFEECDVARVVLLTETEEAAHTISASFPDHFSSGKLSTLITHGDLEGSLDHAFEEFGRPVPVICTPFRPLPRRSLSGSASGEWDSVLSEAEFTELLEHNITHHFRVAKKISLVDNAQLVMVTPNTSSHSTAEELAMANFIKTTLHAFTATLGVESERVVHNVPVNQVDLARRARNEEPRNADEESEELMRFVNAVLLTSAPQVEAKLSRYRSRIYRGNAITV